VTERLLTCAANITLESPSALRNAMASDTPDFVYADFLESELLSHWPDLSDDARLMLIVLAQEIARNNLSGAASE
jgi:hypothetical protein